MKAVPLEDLIGRGSGRHPNQYFSTQVVAISTFWNYDTGNLSKHWSFGRGGGDRTHDLRLKRPLLYH